MKCDLERYYKVIWVMCLAVFDSVRSGSDKTVLGGGAERWLWNAINNVRPSYESLMSTP